MYKQLSGSICGKPASASGPALLSGVRQALLPSCGEPGCGTAMGCPGWVPRWWWDLTVVVEWAPMVVVLGTTSHGFGPGPLGIPVDSSRALRTSLHCTGPTACNNWSGNCARVAQKSWTRELLPVPPPYYLHPTDCSAGYAVGGCFFSRAILKILKSILKSQSQPWF